MKSDNVGNIHVIASRAAPPDILRRAFTQLPSCYCPKQIQRDQLDANDCPDMTGSCGLSTRIICATYIIEQVVVVWSNVDIIIVTANPTAGPPFNTLAFDYLSNLSCKMCKYNVYNNMTLYSVQVLLQCTHFRFPASLTLSLEMKTLDYGTLQVSITLRCIVTLVTLHRSTIACMLYTIHCVLYIPAYILLVILMTLHSSLTSRD